MAPKKNKDWSNEGLEEAVKLVRGGVSKSLAARRYNVPRSTLRDRIKRVVPARRRGKEFLSRDDETQLANYIKFMSDAGAPVTVSWIRSAAGRIASLR